MSLFLKYRPQTFSDVVGQEAVRRTLQNALKAEKPSHAYLFTGSRGTGKTSTARIFAKGLNCENLQNGDPCGVCRFCTGTADGTLIDVIEIDAASNRGIDEIRDLREKINFAPNVARRKVYIIDEVHMMTKEAFNALLKTLEEPPDHAFFCLATTEIHKVPETIKSRCQTFSFQRFTLDQLSNRLAYIAKKEGINSEIEGLNLIARKAEGGLRDAISLLEQVAAETENQVTQTAVQLSLGVSDTTTLINLYHALTTGDSLTGLNILKQLSQNGSDFRSFGHDFLGFLREKMLSQLEHPDLGFTLKCIEEFEVALQRLKTSPIIELPLEIAIINLTQSVAFGLTYKTENLPVSKTTLQTKPLTTATVMASVSAQTLTPKNENEDDGFVFESKITVKEEVTPQVSPIINTVSPKKKEAPPLTNKNLDTDNLKKQMENIAIKSEIAMFAKKSFMTCTPSVDGSLITFCTNAESHREKLDQSEIKSALNKAIAELFGVEGYQVRIVKTGGSAVKPTESDKASGDDFFNF